MYVRLTRKDGSTLEVDGTPEEIAAVMGLFTEPVVIQQPTTTPYLPLQPFTPWQPVIYGAGTADPMPKLPTTTCGDPLPVGTGSISCGCGDISKHSVSAASGLKFDFSKPAVCN